MTQTTVENAATAAAEPAKKNWFRRHKILTGCLVVIGVIAIASSTSTDTTAPTSTGNTGSADTAGTTEAPAALPGIGDTARDGKFEFVVKKITYSAEPVGSEWFNEAPQGHFAIVTVTVTNIGDVPQTLFDDNHYLFVGAKKYAADTDASIAASEETWLQEINPGNSVTGRVYFDLPKGAKGDRLELHDSAFSGGVDVQVG